MTRNRTREAVREPDPADHLRADLRTIADLWPDLQANATTAGPGDGIGPIKGTRDHGIRGNLAAVRLAKEITHDAWYLASIIDRETHASSLPNPLADLPAALRWIATWRADWVANHPDEWLRHALLTDWRRTAARIHAAVLTERPRIVDVGVPCPEHTTSDTGDRIRCTGRLTATLTRPDTVPDLVCDLDTSHRISPVDWQRAARRSGYDIAKTVARLAEA